MSEYKIGIDFGTSNSTCALLDNGLARLLPLEGDKTTLPSSLFFAQSGDIYFGRQSYKAYLDGEEGRFMRGLKSILGTSLMEERTIINRRAINFIDIITIYLRHIKQRAEKHIGAEVHDVVLGRPVHFHDDNPQADQLSEQALHHIAQNIGFKNISFQYEPIAAAFAHERSLKGDQLALVIDLGGGTSDFTVIKLSPQKSTQVNRADDILATTGIRIGGTNFDQKLSISSFMPHLGLGSDYRSDMDADQIFPLPLTIYHHLSDWPYVNFAQTRQAISETKSLLRTAMEPEKIKRLLNIQESGLGHALLQTIEQTKIDLSAAQHIHADLSPVDLDISVSVSRETFETAIQDQITRISTSIDDCLAQAKIDHDAIGLIILTGGSSELPIINQMVANKFPAASLSNDNKFGSVGLGLAYNAGFVF